MKEKTKRNMFLKARKAKFVNRSQEGLFMEPVVGV
jgi:hypothetical protein